MINGFIFKELNENYYRKEKKKPGGRLESTYLANQAQYHSNRAG